ncbi:MAG: OmpA family protein [Bacteroidota bacterium]|nr:OmpA family protein [Bacteroidota bacterium]MDP4232320.1 OmpA family protein [Bacteroidota bacterium]MDP4241459.1 OmpA family protein [Bacteroidota bacterium]MDP4286717.1 OmpA family protein [Bacteroidota bacterium]
MKHLVKWGMALLVVGVLGLMGSSAQAQSKAGQIAFGVDGGGNKYYGNYTDNQFAFQGEAFIRWNIMDWLSLHAAYNGGLLRYKATAASILNSGGGAIGSLNHTRVGGWELMGSYNVFPEQTFVPYVIAGIEALNFEPKDANDAPLRNNAAGVYSKNVIGGAGGVGFEMYLAPNITFNGKGLLHLTGTDWLDDYSDPNNSRQDVFVTMGLGFSYYIFTPAVAPTPMAVVTHDVIERTVLHSDTVYVRDQMDSVYCINPKVGTIFNFPGTLFTVNTDHFNMAVPNNISNLHQIKQLVNQCPELKVEIQGFASQEGPAEHNQTLSEQRAERLRIWLVEQGVDPSKIVRTVGFGETNSAVPEQPNLTAEQLEAARTLNRRIAVKVIEPCSGAAGAQPSR